MASKNLTEKEAELLKKLIAKKRAAAKREIDFWKMVDERENEVIDHIKLNRQKLPQGNVH